MRLDWGIRARVMLAAVLPMLVIAVVLTLSYASSRLADFDQEVVARGKAFARQLAAASEFPVFSGNHQALQQLATAVLGEDDVVGLGIIDRDGRTLARAGILDRQLPALPATATPQASTLRKGPTLRIIEPIRPSRIELDDGFAAISPDSIAHLDAAPLGNVVLELSLRRLQMRRAELMWKGTGLVLMVLLGSVLLASHLSSGVSRPIRRIADTVLAIGRGDLRQRVKPAGGGSLRKLADGVNEMARRLAYMHKDMEFEIERATAELRTRKDEAERANLAKSRFLAAASHDLRQPMHALGLFISELDQQTLPPTARGLVRHIAASADAMEKLLDSLLDISRLDAGVLQPRPRAFALQPLLVRLAVAHEAVAVERGLRLRLRCSGGWVRSDPVLLERILGNLLGNAIRYTPGGTILIACRPQADGMIRIEVRDNGIGIPADKQEIVFQEFVQLDNAERARDKGLGLGLAIVRRLADLLGHRLTLRSAPGHGSVFAIALPRAAESEVDAAQEDERPPGDLGGVRIAVLDDDPLVRAGMASLLGSWGCDVLTAATADDILQRIDAGDWQPALVISDFRLQGMQNGLDFICTVRERLAAPTLAAILISGDTGADMLALTSQSGVPMLHKPVRPARLRALIHRLLQSAHDDDGPR